MLNLLDITLDIDILICLYDNFIKGLLVLIYFFNMAKPIPSGGRRAKQVKVNFNAQEFKKLEEYKDKTGFDRASILRNKFLSFLKLNNVISSNVMLLRRTHSNAVKNYSPVYRGLSKIFEDLKYLKKGFLSKNNELENALKREIEVLDLLIEKISKVQTDLENAESSFDEPFVECLQNIEDILLSTENVNSLPSKSTNIPIEIENTSLLKRDLEIVVFNIEKSSDVIQFLDYLKEETSVILNLDKLSDDIKNLVLDHIKVGTYALNAKKCTLSENIFLFTSSKNMIKIHKSE